jgi:translation initiation factor 1
MSIRTNRPGIDDALDLMGGLPPAASRVTLSTSTRRYGKVVTIVDGLDPKEVDVRALAKRLKSLVAAGGTAKDGRIELQGDHRERVRRELETLGLLSDESGPAPE